jgi:hypothetical protein
MDRAVHLYHHCPIYPQSHRSGGVYSFGFTRVVLWLSNYFHSSLNLDTVSLSRFLFFFISLPLTLKTIFRRTDNSLHQMIRLRCGPAKDFEIKFSFSFRSGSACNGYLSTFGSEIKFSFSLPVNLWIAIDTSCHVSRLYWIISS